MTRSPAPTDGHRRHDAHPRRLPGEIADHDRLEVTHGLKLPNELLEMVYSKAARLRTAGMQSPAAGGASAASAMQGTASRKVEEEPRSAGRGGSSSLSGVDAIAMSSCRREVTG